MSTAIPSAPVNPYVVLAVATLLRAVDTSPSVNREEA